MHSLIDTALGTLMGIELPFNLAVVIPLHEAAAEIVIADDDQQVAAVQQLASATEER